MPPPPHPSTSTQHEVEQRRRDYREAIVRRLVVKHGPAPGRPDWKIEAGWTDADEAKYHAPAPDPYSLLNFSDPRYLSGLTYSTCDVLRYRAPKVTPPSDYPQYPVVPPDNDNSPFHALARLALAAEDPPRQQELFGWQTPVGYDPATAAAFEARKAGYWQAVCAGALAHLDLLKDTADFKANELLRLLYLAGELPPHLSAFGTPGRSTGSPHRDDNFSSGMQDRIISALLAFKFWVDDPFFPGPIPYQPPALFGLVVGPVTEPMYPGDYEAISAARTASPEWNDPEPGRDMTYWSENHQFLFATAEYLAGQWLPDERFQAGLPYRRDAARGPRPGDLTGRDRMAHAKPRLLRWLEDRLRLGLSEWMSPVYYAEDIQPLFNIVDFCLDDDIRDRALIALDRALFDLARFSLGGDFGASAGRCYFSVKACGHDQSVADLAHVVFGNRDGVIVWDGDETAGSFVSSQGYDLPDVLVAIANDRPDHLIDRSRVSVEFDEAYLYGAGFSTPEDAMFWWSRGAFFARAVLPCTGDAVSIYHLEKTPPFNQLSSVRKAIDTSESLPGTLVLSPREASAIEEGSSLTRANLYTYKNRDAMLSSVQNFRAGQLSFQGHPCQATLGSGAVVWTTHLSAGGYVDPAPVVGVLSMFFGGPVGYDIAALAGGNDAQEVIPADSSDGPNWWTGSVTLPRVVQYEGTAIIGYNTTVLDDIFGSQTHAWFPKPAFGDTVRREVPDDCNVDDGNWTFGAVGDGYVGLFSARKADWSSDGPWSDKDLLAEAGPNVFIMQIGNAAEFGSYDIFVRRVRAARIHVHGLDETTDDFECSYDVPTAGGKRLELHWDDDEVRYDGAQFSDNFFPRFETPYVRCGRVDWDQYDYTIDFAGNSLTHDFRELKTKTTGARVSRVIGGRGYDCAANAFWIAARRGSTQSFAENTVSACVQAVVSEQANALALDVGLTADREVVLWVDWDPDARTAVARQRGLADVGGFRPVAPPAASGVRRPLLQLGLAEFQQNYGYAPILQSADAPRLPPSTLTELLAHPGGWRGLQHLMLMVRMADEDGDRHGAELMDAIATALQRSREPLDFDLTIAVTGPRVLAAMQHVAAGLTAPVPVAFALHREVPARATSPDHQSEALAWSPLAYSAVTAAIDHGCSVASLGPVPGAPAPGLEYDDLVYSDLQLKDAFNLNPRTNQGRQIERFVVADPGSLGGVTPLVVDGVSGIVTDDVPGLRQTLADLGR